MNGRTNVTNSTSLEILEIPLNPVTELHSQLKTDVIELMWTDPLDKYADDLGQITDEGDQLVSEWAYTIVVRKIGSQPTGPSDGEVITTSTTRNQYQSSPYTDSTIVAGNTYYYGIYACNTAGIYSEGVFTEGYTPVQYDPILGNNSWDVIDDACSKGLEQSLWAVGDEIDITAMGEILTCVILDFNHDTLTDGSGTASITFGLKNLMSFLNPQQFTGDTFYGVTSGMRGWYDNTLYPGIEDSLRSKLKQVTKTSVNQRWKVTVNEYPGGTSMSSSTYFGSKTTGNCYVFPFAAVEIKSNIESSPGRYERGLDQGGTHYPYYTTIANQVKRMSNGTGAATTWHLRDYTETTGDRSGEDVMYVGSYETQLSSHFFKDDKTANTYGICFGFCIGKAIS